MGFDLFLLSSLVNELNNTISGAKISKIIQPEADEIRLILHTPSSNPTLLISCNPQESRMHLTSTKKQAQKVAPNFCMILRKYILSGIISSLEIFNNDRIVKISITAKDELQVENQYYLFIELMNRYSNIIFTDNNFVIIEAIKHIPLVISNDHVILKGIKYNPIPQPKISYLEDFENVLYKYDIKNDIFNFISNNISGFSGATINEIIKISNYENNKDINSIALTINGFKNNNFIFNPSVYDKEIFPIEYRTKIDKNCKHFTSLSDAFDYLYTDFDNDLRNKQRLKQLSQTTKRLIQKTEKNIFIDNNRLLECESMDTYRLFGELIVNNIYKIKKGDKSLSCINYYNNKQIDIPLDVRYTPSQNSKLYFAKYNKLKRTKEFTTTKLEDDKILLDYLRSIEEEINSLPYDSDYSPIQVELDKLTGNKQSKNKKTKIDKKEPPFIYEIDGYYIYRGKNNIQNNEITFKLAKQNDIWLHLKNEHSAHTIIVSNGETIPIRIIQIAAEITASNKTATAEVDYTERKNVKRHPSSHLGLVVYTNYSTIKVEPNKHLELITNIKTK